MVLSGLDGSDGKWPEQLGMFSSFGRASSREDSSKMDLESERSGKAMGSVESVDLDGKRETSIS